MSRRRERAPVGVLGHVRQALGARPVDAALVVLACAAVGVVAWERGGPSPQHAEARRGALLPQFDAEAVGLVELERGAERARLLRGARDAEGSSSFELEGHGGELVEPTALRRLLHTLESARWLRTIEGGAAGGVTDESLGLASPAAVVRVGQQGTMSEVRLGGVAPAPAGARYALVQVGSSTVRGVLSAEEARALEVGVAELRDPLLLRVGRSAMRRLTLDGLGGRRVLDVGPDGLRFSAMEGDRLVGRAAEDRLLLALSRLRVTAPRLPAAEAPSGAVTVVVEPTDGPTVKLALGGECPGSPEALFAQRLEPSPLAGCVPADVLGPLALPADELVAREVTRLRPDEVERVVVTRGAERLEVSRSGDGFVVRHPAGVEVEAAAVEARLGALTGARGEAADDAPRPGGAGPSDVDAWASDPGAGSVELWPVGLSDGPPVRLRVGPQASDGGFSVRREIDGQVLRLAAELADAFGPGTATLRPTTLVQRDPLALRALSITTDGASEGFAVEQRARGEWVLGDGSRADATLAMTAATALGSLRARRWVADEVAPAHGLDAPRFTITARFDGGDGPEEVVLDVGAAAVGGAFARVRALGGVFVLGRSELRALTTLPMDRDPIRVPLALVESVAIVAGGKRLELVRQGDGFAPGGDLAGASPADVGRLADALAELRAVEALPLEGGPALGTPRLELDVRLRDGRAERWVIGQCHDWHGREGCVARVGDAARRWLVPQAVVDALLP